jgi:RHS repeat-associated protein
VTFQYDQLGRVISRAINGVAQTATFDVLGRPTMVTNALGIFQYAYVDATSRLASESYPNGQTNLYSYYNNLGDQRILQAQKFYPNGSLLSGFGYAYNAVGQITALTNQWDNLPTRVWLPSYDAVDELTNVTVNGGSGAVNNYSYAYDLAGNRITSGTNVIRNEYYYNTLNQLVGSSTKLTSVSYEWDAENRLTAINDGPNRSEFSYDGLGRRDEIVEKTNGVVMTNNYYLWCGTKLCELRDDSGSNVLRRLYQQGESLGGASGVSNYFYARDHLRSVREAVDSNGTLQTRYDYDPYGQQTVIQENQNTVFAFTGDLIHIPSKLYLTQYRAYDGLTGRWLSKDPLGEFGFETARQGGAFQNPNATIDTANLYIYADDNPINASDPTGLLIWVCTRRTDFGIGRHAYFWDDTTRTSCGMRSSSGLGPNSSTDDTPGQMTKCWPVAHSQGKEADIMKCCHDTANNGIWFPPHDCHHAVNRCLSDNGLYPPRHPRF